MLALAIRNCFFPSWNLKWQWRPPTKSLGIRFLHSLSNGWPKPYCMSTWLCNLAGWSPNALAWPWPQMGWVWPKPNFSQLPLLKIHNPPWLCFPLLYFLATCVLYLERICPCLPTVTAPIHTCSPTHTLSQTPAHTNSPQHPHTTLYTCT